MEQFRSFVEFGKANPLLIVGMLTVVLIAIRLARALGREIDKIIPLVIIAILVSFATACTKSPTSATTYDKLTVALDQPGLPVAVGHIVCLSAQGGDSRYQWTLERGFGAITAIGAQAACFVLTTSDAYEVEVVSGDGQRASISTPVLPLLPSICNTGTVAVLTNNQNGTWFLQRPDGISFGWEGNYSVSGSQVGTWTIHANDLAGFTKTVSPSSSGNLTGCGALAFVIMYTPTR